MIIKKPKYDAVRNKYQFKLFRKSVKYTTIKRKKQIVHVRDYQILFEILRISK